MNIRRAGQKTLQLFAGCVGYSAIYCTACTWQCCYPLTNISNGSGKSAGDIILLDLVEQRSFGYVE